MMLYDVFSVNPYSVNVICILCNLYKSIIEKKLARCCSHIVGILHSFYNCVVSYSRVLPPNSLQ